MPIVIGNHARPVVDLQTFKYEHQLLTKIATQEDTVDTGKTYLLYPCPQKAPNQKLEPLKFRLDDNKFKVRLRIHIARLIFHELNLSSSIR